MTRSADRLGASLIVLMALWTIRVGVSAGQPWPLVGLLAGVLAAFVIGRRLGRAAPLIVSCGLAVLPLATAAVTRRSPLGDGVLGYANASGAFYLLAGAAALSAAGWSRQPWSRGGLRALAGLWLVGPLLVGARTASLGVILLLVAVFVIERAWHVRTILSWATTILILVVGSTIALGATYDVGGRADMAARAIDAGLGELRVALWHDAVNMIRDRPLSGVGPTQFARMSPTAPLVREEGQWAHSEYLQMAAETGLVGGLLLVALIATGIVMIWRRQPGPLAMPVVIACLVVTINAGIDYLWHFPVVPWTMAGLVGLATAPELDTSAGTEQSFSFEARRVFGASMLLGLILLLPIPPFNTPYEASNDVRWAEPGPGLHFPGSGGVISENPPERLYDKMTDIGEFTVELSLAPTSLAQSGPARIVSMSDGSIHRNLTIGQEDDELVVRLRSTETDWNGMQSSLNVAGALSGFDRSHVVVTGDLHETQVYVDGSIRASTPGPGGDLSNWIHRYPLLLGNERGGNRPWAGQLYLVAMYAQTVDRSQVELLYASHQGTVDEARTARESSAIALYTFGEGAGASIVDDSELGLGGRLSIPSRFASEPDGFVRAFLDRSEHGIGRVLLHVVGFLGWTLALWPLLAHRLGTPKSATFLAGLALTGILGASGFRYLSGLSTTVLDLGAASIGTLVGGGIASWLKRR